MGPSSHTASALSPALPHHMLGGHGAPGSLSPSLGSLPQASGSVAAMGSPADITLTPHIPMDSIKESVVKSLQVGLPTAKPPAPRRHKSRPSLFSSACQDPGMSSSVCHVPTPWSHVVALCRRSWRR